jgi:hypothetical protein
VTREQRLEEIWARSRIRAAEALRLRREGLTYRAIGERMGVGTERASQLVRRGELYENGWSDAEERANRLRREAEEMARIMAAREREPEPAKPDMHDPDIVHAHALQQLWRQFIEPHGAWRRPLVGPYRPLHDWLDWRGSAGVTYRNLPGRLEPEWRVSA